MKKSKKGSLGEGLGCAFMILAAALFVVALSLQNIIEAIYKCK